jgi:GT2 family glycosyltransferase
MRVEGARAATVSVIICAYTERRWEDLAAAYESVRAQTRPVEQIVMVIDHNDALLTRTTAAFPAALVLANQQASGLSGARNTGVEAAGAEILLFLDDDAVADPDWVERMLEPLRDPDVLGVGGWAIPRWAPVARPEWFPEPFLWVVGCSYQGLPTSTADIRNPLGCAMGFRRSAFDLAGGFSSSLGRVGGGKPTGCEETEFSIRVQQAKPTARIVLEPTARVRHHVTADRTRVRYFLSRCYHEGRSKALLSGVVGPQDSLASERTYVTGVLPRAVGAGLRKTLRTGKLSGVGSSLAILAGLGAAGLGYLSERARNRPKPA